ncbi:hypothetical protein [Bacillus pseudomycoides]|uniref:hypothetical protein n=1 Tax=Bacillus pseudomycoides TaxID=64104 RepID=UPI000BF8D089|nr:hypothetical protein [Bacillus pseudomycoides]PEP47798.1 hypothetical protein CN564_27900 [Bacillus pseudomycoides]PHC86226.1 hypothetical protein COF36_24375 [Bacillus pseudomycoides]
MISIGIGLSVILIAFLCTRVYPFQQEKLEKGKCDIYGLWLMLWTGICIYLSDHYFQEDDLQWILRLMGATCVMGIVVSFVGRQLMYDYKSKKLSFRGK